MAPLPCHDETIPAHRGIWPAATPTQQTDQCPGCCHTDLSREVRPVVLMEPGSCFSGPADSFLPRRSCCCNCWEQRQLGGRVGGCTRVKGQSGRSVTTTGGGGRHLTQYYSMQLCIPALDLHSCNAAAISAIELTASPWPQDLRPHPLPHAPKRVQLSRAQCSALTALTLVRYSSS